MMLGLSAERAEMNFFWFCEEGGFLPPIDFVVGLRELWFEKLIGSLGGLFRSKVNGRGFAFYGKNAMQKSFLPLSAIFLIALEK